MEATVFIILQIFFATYAHGFENWGVSLRPWFACPTFMPHPVTLLYTGPGDLSFGSFMECKYRELHVEKDD